MFKNFQNYKLVYSHLLHTYWANWWVRLSYLMAFTSRIVKLVFIPIAISLIVTNISTQNYKAAYITIGFYAIFSLLMGIFASTIRYVGMLGENKIYRQATAGYMAKLVSCDIEFFNSNLSGSLTTSARNYVDGNLQLVRSIRGRYLNNVLSIILPICVIMWFDLALGATVVVLFLVQMAYILWASRAIDPIRAETRKIYKYNTGKMADLITNVLTVKSTAQEQRFIDQTKRRAAKESATYQKRYTKQAVLISYREAITTIILVTLLLLTVWRMSTGAISLTIAILVITYTTTIITAIYALSEDIDEHDDYIDKIVPELITLNMVNKIQDPKHPLDFINLRGDITFNNVNFAYDKNHPNLNVLSNFNLHVPAGQKLGIVGVSGAGKSTLTKLLLRFNDVDDGSILIDGTDIRQVKQADLRRNISLVPQEPMLFHTSIKDNVVVAKPDASEPEIDEVLKTAHAYNFVNKLPDGINSIVGERGVKLSGGQKQRIAIARALLQNAPIMVFDEATSALDSESEQIIKNAFSEILGGKTAIITAHRLSTLSEMDRIIVIDKGQIIEDGTHEQLVQKNGKYAKLWRYQQRLSINS